METSKEFSPHGGQRKAVNSTGKREVMDEVVISAGKRLLMDSEVTSTGKRHVVDEAVI